MMASPDDDFTVARWPAHFNAVIPGPYWLIAFRGIGVAVLKDATLAERIHDLLVEHGVVDLDAITVEALTGGAP